MIIIYNKLHGPVSQLDHDWTLAPLEKLHRHPQKLLQVHRKI